jgi:hypothetical protein
VHAGTAGDLGLHTPLVASSAFVRRYDPEGSVEVNPGEDSLGLCKKQTWKTAKPRVNNS